MNDRKLSSEYIRDNINMLYRVVPHDLTTIPQVTKYESIALRNYLNFLVNNGLINEDEASNFKKKLPKRKSNPDMYVPSNETVLQAYNNIKDKRIRTMFEILAFSGIRVTELVKLVQEFDQSKLTVVGNIAKYQLLYSRGQKNSYYVYLPLETSKKLHKYYITKNIINHRISKTGLNPKYLRKWLYNFLIYNNVPEGVADFIEGRTPNSVGSMHYLARAKQSDFWYSKVVSILMSTF